MATEEKITFRGQITGIQRGTKFDVKLENGHTITATLSGKLKINQIRILVGDFVDVEVSAYDITKGRIIWRYR